MNKDEMKELILELLKDKDIQGAIGDFIWDMPLPPLAIPTVVSSVDLQNEEIK